MTTPSEPRDFVSHPGRPRRPEISRDAAPLRRIKPPVLVERLLQVWLAELTAGLLALMGGLLTFVDAKRELLAARVQDASAHQAVNLVLYGSLGMLGLWLVLGLWMFLRLQRRHGGRVGETLLAVGQAAALPLLLETVGTASTQGLVVVGLLIAAAILNLLVAGWSWLPGVTAWLRS